MRRFEKAFLSKLYDSESEAAETQVWLEFAVNCGYLQREDVRKLYQTYNEILKLVVSMIRHPELWILSYNNKTIEEEAEEYDTFF